MGLFSIATNPVQADQVIRISEKTILPFRLCGCNLEYVLNEVLGKLLDMSVSSDIFSSHGATLGNIFNLSPIIIQTDLSYTCIEKTWRNRPNQESYYNMLFKHKNTSYMPL